MEREKATVKGARINIPPSELWDYFYDNLLDLEDHEILIAENVITGVEIYLTEFGGRPLIGVFVDNREETEESCVSEADAMMTLEAIYNEYLGDELLDEREDEDLRREIEDRDLELSSTFDDFLLAVYEDKYYAVDEETAAEMLDDVLQYLSERYGMPIYRPMYVEYDDGTVEFEEYPYLLDEAV